ncbi:MAG: TolC family protein [Chitinispirillaceae bacterium]
MVFKISLIRFTPLLLWAATCALGQTLTLKYCEEKTLERNFSLQAARFQRNSVKWQKYSTIATILPSVALNTNWLETEDLQSVPSEQQPIPGQSPTTGSTFSQNGFFHQLTINQPIFNGGGEILSYFLASNNLEAANYRLRAARQDAILQVRNAYFNALLLSEQKKIDSLGLEWTRRNLYQARIRHEEGVLPPYELLRWEAEVAERRGSVINSYALYRGALSQLFLTMGQQPQESIGLQLEDASLLERLFEQSAELPEGSWENSPELLAAQEELSIARQNTFLTLTKFLPNINGFLRYDWPAQDSFFPQGESVWTYGVNINWTLFSGAKRFSDYFASRNQYQQFESQLGQLAEQNRISVIQTRTLYRASKEQVKSAKTRFELMQRTLSMMEQRYETGMVGISELLEVRIQTDSAHIMYLRSLVDALVTESEYRSATGQLEGG